MGFPSHKLCDFLLVFRVFREEGYLYKKKKKLLAFLRLEREIGDLVSGSIIGAWVLPLEFDEITVLTLCCAWLLVFQKLKK